MSGIIEIRSQHGQPKKYRPECTDKVHSSTWHGAGYAKRSDAEDHLKTHKEQDVEVKERIAAAEAERKKRTPKEAIDAAQDNQVQL